MKLNVLTTAVVFVVALAGYAVADEKHPTEGMAGQKLMDMGAAGQEGEMKHGQKVACAAPAHLTAEAETKPGGAFYKGPMPKHAMDMGDTNMGAVRVSSGTPSAELKNMKEMAGAHNVHKGARGGELIMVPNQLHHLEVVYSLECGYQLFFYNAFTEAIRADRFQAFMLVLPEEGNDFFEVMRFLTPSADGSHLATRIAHTHDGPRPKGIFETDLYVKFPGHIEPMLFEVIVGPEVTWE